MPIMPNSSCVSVSMPQNVELYTFYIYYSCDTKLHKMTQNKNKKKKIIKKIKNKTNPKPKTQ